MNSHPLGRVLQPRSVVVVGASRNPAKRGHHALRALIEQPFDGSVYAVNPNGGEILGLPVYPSVMDLPDAPDLAFITTPALSVPDILRRCAERGVAGAVVTASGFGESDEGVALARSVDEIVQGSKLRLIGPNTSGVICTAVGLNLLGLPDLTPGDLALLSQSGNVALDVINSAARDRVGISLYVGVGNEMDISFHEYLGYLEHDPATRAIMMYVEGFRDGRAFIEAARRVTMTKPVVLLKGGRSDRGVAAARSHTGAIAGSYPVLRAALRHGGVSEVRRSDELLAVARAMAYQPPVPSGMQIAVLSDGGGHGTLAADALAGLGVPMAHLAASTQAGLRTLLGSAASVNNPVDVAGAADGDVSVFEKAIDLLVRDPSVGGILLVGLFGGYALRFSAELADQELRTAENMASLMRDAGKPFVVHSLYAARQTESLERLRELRVTVVQSLEVGSRCVRALHARGLYLDHEPVPASIPAPRSTQPVSIVVARREGRATLMEIEARELLGGYNVPLAEATLCRSAEEVAAAIAAVGGPVALKVVSPTISHKTEAGGVVLDVGDPEAGRVAFASVLRSAAEYALERGLAPDLRGVLVMPMLPDPVAELIVGVRHDAHFGPVLTVGAGGIAVEIHHDTALRGLPIGRREALDMLDEIRISRLLNGYRGRPPANRDALANIILGVAACALANHEIEELEANPVFAYADRAVVVDARAFLNQLDQPARQLGDALDDERIAV